MNHPTDRPIKAQDSGPWKLTQYGAEVIVGTEAECLNWIHSHTPYSAQHAFRYEGYKLEATKVG